MLHSTLPLEWKIKDGRRYCVRARGLLNGRLILMLVILLIVSEKVERGETEDETGSVSPPVSSRASNLSRSLDTSKFSSNSSFSNQTSAKGSMTTFSFMFAKFELLLPFCNLQADGLILQEVI